jgi:hypothetical protein
MAALREAIIAYEKSEVKARQTQRELNRDKRLTPEQAQLFADLLNRGPEPCGIAKQRCQQAGHRIYGSRGRACQH